MCLRALLGRTDWWCDGRNERATEKAESDKLREQAAAIKNELPTLQKEYQKATEARTALKKEQFALVQRFVSPYSILTCIDVDIGAWNSKS